jgi:hypothetical protein
MRSKLIKNKEAILICGGPHFKVYSIEGLDGWLVNTNKKYFEITKGHMFFKTVTRYVNLRYEPLGQQDSVSKNFNFALLDLMMGEEK